MIPVADPGVTGNFEVFLAQTGELLGSFQAHNDETRSILARTREGEA